MKRFSGTKSHIANVALAGLTILLASFCSRAHALYWSRPQAIAAGGRLGVSLAVDSQGNWHVVYDTKSDGEYYIHYLSSTGAQHIIAQGTYGQTTLSAPAIDVDSNGGLHVVYLHYNWISGQLSVMYTYT
jgi:hypothetical protein